jgi:hypothetical protein
MLRFGMSRDSDCTRCGEVETYQHLFWQCTESRRIWESYNHYISNLGQGQEQNLVQSYEDVFRIGNNKILSIIKVRVIQPMIQIERPRGWNVERVRKLATELKAIEIYNSTQKQCIETTKERWEFIR